MPIIPPILNAPYDPVETVLQFTRVIVNDCEVDLGGDLLSDAQPGTLPMLNLAWRKLQDRLGNNSVEAFPKEVILTGIPAMSSQALLDPANRVYIDFSGYFNGQQLTQGSNYALPQDLEIPLKIWERPTGQNSFFFEVAPVTSLPSRPKSSFELQWVWEDNKLFMPGSSQAEDIRIRYKQFKIDTTSVNQPLSILRCAVALAYEVAEIFIASHGGTVFPIIQSQKEDCIKQLINNTIRKKQGQNFRKQPYSRRGRRLF